MRQPPTRALWCSENGGKLPDPEFSAKHRYNQFSAPVRMSQHPADVLMLPDASLLVSDNSAGAIWRIVYHG